MLLQRLTSGAVAAADQAAPLLKRLDPERRAGILLALAGLVLLGCAMLALVWLGAHHVRRLARQRPRPRRRDPSDWDRKRPAEDDPGGEGAGENGEGRSSNDQ